MRPPPQAEQRIRPEIQCFCVRRAGIARVQKLLLVDAALNGIESLFVDQRLVLTVNENDILICKVAAVRPAGFQRSLPI